jgi:hypothetical protein
MNQLSLPRIVTQIILIAILLITSRCSDSDTNEPQPDGGDTGTPDISFENIRDQQLLSGNFPVTLKASDKTGISKIEIDLDNMLLLTLTTAPYQFDLNTVALSDGVHTIKATAWNNAGNRKSVTVAITIENGGTTGNTLLSLDVPDQYLGNDNIKPVRAFILLSDENWKAITYAEIKNGQHITLQSSAFSGNSFTVTEFLLYENQWTSLRAWSYLHVDKGTWVLNTPAVTPPQTAKISFNFFIQDAGYNISSNGGLAGGFAFVYKDSTSPFSTNMTLTQSPGKLFVRQTLGGVDKFHFYENPEIRIGGNYQVDFRTVFNADDAFTFEHETLQLDVSEFTIRLFGLPKANDTREAFQLGTYLSSASNHVSVSVPKSSVNPFADYFSITEFKKDNAAIRNAGFGKFDDRPLAATATVTAERLTTTGSFDLFNTSYNWNNDIGVWNITGPPVNDFQIANPELPTALALELNHVNFNTLKAEPDIRLSDFKKFGSYSEFIGALRLSQRGFTEVIALPEEKRITFEN